MKLHELRQILKEYDQTWYVRKYFYGDHERAKKFRNYVQKFNTFQDDYELTASDIFRLLKKIPEIAAVGSNLQFIDSIRNKLGNNYLFEIYTILNSAKLITEHNFQIIYGLPHQGRSLLQSLFCGLPSQRIALNSEILATVLAIASQSTYYSQSAEQSLRFLHNRNHLTTTALNLLVGKINEIHTIFQILQELDKAKCLNDTCLEYFAQLESLYSIDTLISLLNRAKITLSDEFIKSICTNTNIHYLVEIVSTLLGSKEFLLKIETLTMLLKQDFKFFLDKNSALKLLQENDLLDEKAFDHVCTNDIFSLNQILKILLDKSLLKENKEIISKIINKEFDGYRFYRAIGYLQKANLLDQKSLTSCFKLILIKPKAELFKTGVFNLFELFDKSNFSISNEKLDALFSLSDSNLQRLYGMVLRLTTSKLLDQNSFEKAFQRVTAKLPSVLESTVSKNSRKKTNASRSEFTLDNKNSFFIEHSKQYESGGFGKVKKGYSSPDSAEPIYGIKKLNESEPTKAQNAAIREIKYHRLLGRQAFYFSRNGATSIVSEWQREKSVDKYNSSELLQVSIEKRLRCLSSGLSDLNILHQYYRIHGDVKCQNFILNLNNTSMKLIDFGTSHKRGSSKSFGWTTAYSDPHAFGDHFCKDLYAMGIVTMYLFPEIYTVSFDKDKANISVNKTSFTIVEQSIVNLVNSMMHSDISSRCTSEDALHYCNELITHFNQMDEELLGTIENSTISRVAPTVEHMFRM
ncbi:TPA: protein kinase domain-containing protein [Legionella pneumophila]|uniref:protein kinase domain-containing protein n=2 Tax=Legionella pneumophila TaxID=446 RepID=UPI000D070B2F|nr:protein kinase [Legionella pneumophila]HAT1881778.1 protein kinase family protein [Legionella pneumophila]HAT2113684.1 protein kinase family protein [Legionella pneumophila]HAT8720635.1 protein kinase family protein [Legionella pneumophila]HBD7101059.1 protein kinase family protein [Legionella pneumophila]HCO4737285.1 protein kinase family protein [Legionella pneumophila]